MSNSIHYKYDASSKEPWGDPLEMHLYNKNEIYHVYNSKMNCSGSQTFNVQLWLW